MSINFVEPTVQRCLRAFAGPAALAAIVVGILTTAGPAWASATITAPIQGQTVTLTKSGQIEFRWTLPAGESEPEVEFARPASASGEPGEALGFYCGAQMGQGQTETSCAGNTQLPEPVRPGAYYAYVSTVNGEGVRFTSPEIGFVVPVGIGWGCSPYDPDCRLPRVQNFYLPHGDGSYGAAFSQLIVNGWADGQQMTATFTLSRGRRILKRLHTTEPLEGAREVRASLELYRVPGLRPGTLLTCTIALSTGGTSITRTVPVRSGGGSKTGAYPSLSTN